MVNLIKPTPNENNDSVEFYTVAETGQSGLSQTGLAILCGVSRQAVINLENTLVKKPPSRWLESFVGQDLTLVSSDRDPDLRVNNVPVGNLKIYKASVCARFIQHYAFQGNEIAQYSLDQFTERGITQWIQEITGWQATPQRTYIPYWYQRLTLFTTKTRVPDGWWSTFEELAKLMRELEGLGYVLPDVSPVTGARITPDISIGQLFCRYMRQQGYDIDQVVRKYRHYYPDGREIDANIYPNDWLIIFRTWFDTYWKRERLINYLGTRDPESLPLISQLLELPEAQDE